MVQFGGPGWSQFGVGAFERGGCQGAGKAPPQGGGGHFCGQWAVRGDGLVEECGDVSAGSGSVVEVGGQPGPERVVDDVGVDVVGELAPAGGVGAGAGEVGVKAGVDELLDHGRAVGVLFGSGDAGVGGIDVMGGAEDGDFGHECAALID